MNKTIRLLIALAAIPLSASALQAPKTPVQVDLQRFALNAESSYVLLADFVSPFYRGYLLGRAEAAAEAYEIAVAAEGVQP